jgi:hypothetical protein
MRTTRDHALVGKTFFDASVHTIIALADLTKTGNMGLEGADDDFTTKRFDTAEEARHWCEAFTSDEGEVADAKVSEVTYDEDSWDDDEYGTILDGIERTVTIQYGSLDGSDEWHWTAPETYESSW